MMPAHPQRTILLIDDEEPACKLVKLLLEGEGYHVVTASNGEEGFLLAKRDHPDIVLLDIIMPRLNGHELLRRLKKDPEARAIPVIMLTAKGAEHDITTSLELGAVFHVEKPFESRDLLEKIRAACLAGSPPPAHQPSRQ
ncbi:MAG: response regulator [Elusimicrobia bacterium]|nr:response regulator [Elusimicrobiota bacterium]